MPCARAHVNQGVAISNTVSSLLPPYSLSICTALVFTAWAVALQGPWEQLERRPSTLGLDHACVCMQTAKALAPTSGLITICHMSGVAMVWVGRRGCIKTYNAAPDKVYNSVPVFYTWNRSVRPGVPTVTKPWITVSGNKLSRIRDRYYRSPHRSPFERRIAAKGIATTFSDQGTPTRP